MSRHSMIATMMLMAMSVAICGCAESPKTAAKPPTADARRQYAAQYLRDADVVIEFLSWSEIKMSRPAIMRGEELRTLNRDGLVSALKLHPPKTGLAAVRFDYRYNDNFKRKNAPSEYPDMAEIEKLVKAAGFRQVVFINSGTFGDIVVAR